VLRINGSVVIIGRSTCRQAVSRFLRHGPDCGHGAGYRYRIGRARVPYAKDALAAIWAIVLIEQGIIAHRAHLITIRMFLVPISLKRRQ
jgi:hypothetical protein